MKVPSLGSLERAWPVTIGLVIFGALVVASATGHYLFNPFIFGGVYAVIYLLRRSFQPIDEGRHSSFAIDALRQRLLAVSIIALLSMFGALVNEANRDAFRRNFEKTCYLSRYARIPITIQLCEELQGHMDYSILGELESSDDVF